jgi:hypothetical protein
MIVLNGNKVADYGNKVVDYGNRVMDCGNKVADWEFLICDSFSIKGNKVAD